MARDDERRDERDRQAPDERNTSGSGRDRYRDNDDVRDPLEPDERVGTSPDTKNEARGDARENVGNTAHDQVGRSDL
jgi:hypothetical protein